VADDVRVPPLPLAVAERLLRALRRERRCCPDDPVIRWLEETVIVAIAVCTATTVEKHEHAL
jgi:hypothetical protein